ncbi:DUF3710 domain-containing protein [Nocardia jinanensis]|uniref:DUF3710 domain-containing protein n=1 Tax=Nocardia jinanensis TaxID=382504 RepID=A0A917R854_9NOCA|nr:DUF3710 domain-containing protein [Nocardia jinanensis]GGK94876.1 hypothetical protein GCM10011588_06600 [Nocardia jinanensis]
MFGRRKSGGRRSDDGHDTGEYSTGEYETGEYEDYDDGGYHRADYDKSYSGEYDDSYDDGYGGAAYSDAYDAAIDDPDTEPQRRGPYDYDDVAEVLETFADTRLDLGSVILPVPPGGQLQVEMTPQGTPQAVHLATEHGRITVAAYAAPKSKGQWRTVAADLAESLRKDGARVSVEKGPWGRELVAVTEGADLRFIGVDGARWMIRLVAAGPSGSTAAGGPLVVAARTVLSETIIRRGTDALPVREPLPVVLPQQLAEQLTAAHQQQQQQAQQQVATPPPGARPSPTPAVLPPQQPQQPRRGAEGSAMQQLGRN